MNPLPKLIMVGTLIATSATAHAESVVEVTAVDNVTTSTVPLTLDTKITFGEHGFEIATGEAAISSFSYADSQSISFKTGISGIANVGADHNQPLSLRENPVGTTLEVLNHDGEPSSLSITSMSGQIVSSIPQWNGEDVNVSHLTSGLYLLTINNQTIKFIKK